MVRMVKCWILKLRLKEAEAQQQFAQQQSGHTHFQLMTGSDKYRSLERQCITIKMKLIKPTEDNND